MIHGAVSHWWVFHWWYFSMLYNFQWDCSCIRWICQQLSDSKHFCWNLSATSGRPFSSQFSADTLTGLYGKQGSYSEQDCWDPIYTIRIIYTMSIWSKHVKAKSVASRNDVMSQVSAHCNIRSPYHQGSAQHISPDAGGSPSTERKTSPPGLVLSLKISCKTGHQQVHPKSLSQVHQFLLARWTLHFRNLSIKLQWQICCLAAQYHPVPAAPVM